MPIASYIALVFPFVVLVPLLLGMPNVPYEMDNGNGSAKGTFFPLLLLYQALFYFIAIVGLLLRVKDQLFIIAVVEALLFNGLTLFFYESYLHQRYPGLAPTGTSNYSLLRYSIVLSLGFSAVATFVAAVVRGAWR